MANGPFWVWKRAEFFPYTAEQEAVYIESLTDSSQQSCGVGTNNLTCYLWGQDQPIRNGARTEARGKGSYYTPCMASVLLGGWYQKKFRLWNWSRLKPNFTAQWSVWEKHRSYFSQYQQKQTHEHVCVKYYAYNCHPSYSRTLKHSRV